jgi:hypothetical protein
MRPFTGEGNLRNRIYRAHTQVEKLTSGGMKVREKSRGRAKLKCRRIGEGSG